MHISQVIRKLRYRGSKYYKATVRFIKAKLLRREFGVRCNICGHEDFAFLGSKWHKGIVCSNCGSSIRHRLFWAAVSHNRKFDFKLSESRVIHFAPDNCIKERLKEKSGQYLTADLVTEGQYYKDLDYNIDMTNMDQIQENEFDLLLAFDVLEHIPKHIDAIKETHRILKNGGYCIFSVPQKDGLIHSEEDLTITNSKDREKKFGQFDHWRIYGDDFKDFLEDNGFKVTIVDKNSFEDSFVEKSVLYPPQISRHPLATNNRRIYFGQKM